MNYIIDGIEYEEYPDLEERIATLRADRNYWRLQAFRMLAKSIRAEEGKDHG